MNDDTQREDAPSSQGDEAEHKSGTEEPTAPSPTSGADASAPIPEAAVVTAPDVPSRSPRADADAGAPRDEDQGLDDEDNEAAVPPSSARSAAPAATRSDGAPLPAEKSGSHGEEPVSSGARHGNHGEIGHVVSLPLLVAVFVALLVLTGVTVGVTTVDFGPAMNLTIAMVVATVKAALVIAIFMHLWFDRRLNLLLFLSSVLFVVLFISLASIDRSEYQSAIDLLEAQRAAAAP